MNRSKGITVRCRVAIGHVVAYYCPERGEVLSFFLAISQRKLVRTDMGGPNATRSVEEGADTAVWLADEAPHELTGKFFVGVHDPV
jgi:hypothetical protein